MKKIIGLLPASGRALRFGGLPKFAFPCDENNTPLIKKHVDNMSFYVDEIVISTTSLWKPLVDSFKLNAEICIIEPSTMNDALIKMSSWYKADKYIVGMPDTYFKGENPYKELSEKILSYELVIACWRITENLRGKVGQVELVKNSITSMQDKNLKCDYDHLWGALGFDAEALNELNKYNDHPGIDLPLKIINDYYNHYAFNVNGEYFDVGTIQGYKNLLDSVI